MAKNNKTRFFCVLYSDKTWVFDQSERAQGPIYIIKGAIIILTTLLATGGSGRILSRMG